ncbi:putative transcriptional regulator tpeD [Wolffia australiana]
MSADCNAVEVDDNISTRSGRRNRSKVLDHFVEVALDEYQCTLCQVENPIRKVVGDIPAPDAVKTMVERVYREVQGKLVEMFANVSSVSLTVDAWTSQNNLALLGITAHWIDNDRKLCELLLGLQQIKGPHSDLNLAMILVEVANHYGIESKICAITTDNAFNNRTMMASIVDQLKTVNPQFTMDRHVPCIAHVRNLVVQAGLRGHSQSRTSGN